MQAGREHTDRAWKVCASVLIPDEKSPSLCCQCTACICVLFSYEKKLLCVSAIFPKGGGGGGENVGCVSILPRWKRQIVECFIVVPWWKMYVLFHSFPWQKRMSLMCCSLVPWWENHQSVLLGFQECWTTESAGSWSVGCHSFLLCRLLFSLLWFSLVFFFLYPLPL